jgi:hypothetical protein
VSASGRKEAKDARMHAQRHVITMGYEMGPVRFNDYSPPPENPNVKRLRHQNSPLSKCPLHDVGKRRRKKMWSERERERWVTMFG